MQDKNKKSIELLSNQIIDAVKTVCSKLEFDKTYIGIISSVNSDGYTVKYNGTEINIKTSATNVFKKNDMVKFCIPCGNKQKAYIVINLDLVSKLNIDGETVGVDLNSHISNKNNPHSVTKEQIGLGNVQNVSTNDQTPTYTTASMLTTLTSGETLSIAFGKIAKAVSDLINHITNKNNPHETDKTDVGLGNVPNVSTNDQTPTYTTYSTLTALSSGENLSIAFGKIAKAINDLISHINNKNNPHGITLEELGAVSSLTDIANNLTTTTSGYVLDARQGKALNDKITEKTKFTAVTFTPTDGTVVTADAFNVNRVVSFSINTNNNNNLGAGTYSQIGTMSVKPYKTIEIEGLCGLEGTGIIKIDTNGNVYLKPRQDDYLAGTAIVFNGQYRVAS